MPGDCVWLPEIGLGIGRDRGSYLGIIREWLYWYNEQGQRYLTPEERTQEAEPQRLEAERRVQVLEEMLKNLGVNPENL